MNDVSRDLERALTANALTGASFAYWDGAKLITCAVGRRNSVTADPVTDDTVMHVGSITKVLTTVLLMQLVDEGALRLTDAVSGHLPELRLGDSGALNNITCGMLIDHTTGIDGDWLPEYGPDSERIVDAVSRAAELTQLFAPGAATSYCNIATVIAGYLVQRIRGVSWYTLVRTRIYDALELRHSLADIADVPRFRCSVGDLTDLTDGAMVQTARPFLSPSFAPAGSTLMMSASDLVTFARALLNGGVGLNGERILSRSSAIQMTQPRGVFVSPNYQMGLGWMIAPGEVLTHSGVGPGVYSVLFAHPASGRVVVLLTNCDRGNLLKPRIIDPILETWTGIRSSIERPEVTAADPQLYLGAYESNLQRVEVHRHGDGLAISIRLKMDLYDNSPYGKRATGRAPLRLHPLGGDRFEAEPLLPRGSNIELKFVHPNSAGRMGYLGMGYRILRRTE
jgi:CubicO group peptidase (beta-lactamase class C family)